MRSRDIIFEGVSPMPGINFQLFVDVKTLRTEDIFIKIHFYCLLYWDGGLSDKEPSHPSN